MVARAAISRRETSETTLRLLRRFQVSLGEMQERSGVLRRAAATAESNLQRREMWVRLEAVGVQRRKGKSLDGGARRVSAVTAFHRPDRRRRQLAETTTFEPVFACI
jgi:hypothetical protein